MHLLTGECMYKEGAITVYYRHSRTICNDKYTKLQRVIVTNTEVS